MTLTSGIFDSGAELPFVVARCAGSKHHCQALISYAIRKRKIIVVHHEDGKVSTVKMNLVPAKRQITRLGMDRMELMLEVWHERGFYHPDTQPKASLDKYQCRWLGLRTLTIEYLISDLALFITEPGHTMPLIIPQPPPKGYAPGGAA